MKHAGLSLIALAGCILLGAAAPAAADWPQFRGPSADGHAPAPEGAETIGVPLTWSETENVRWKTEIPMLGWSTPVILGDQIWLTTAEKEGHDFYALCLDQASGKIVHNLKLFHSDNPEPLGNPDNCYASPSPAIEPGRVYVHFGSYGTACLDTATGKEVWRRTDLPCRHFRGPGSSLTIFENLLILTMDGVDVQYLAALDKLTGRTVWKTDRTTNFFDLDGSGQPIKEGDMRKAYTTPLAVKIGDNPQLISPGAKAAYSYDPRSGKELWHLIYKGFSNVASPLFGHGLVYIHAGNGVNELWAVRPDGVGDVSASHVLWKTKIGTWRTPSPLMVEDLIYAVAESGEVTCLNALSGKIVWEKMIGGRYAASPIFAAGRLYFCSREGTITVLAHGRAPEVLAVNKLGDGVGGFMASPAVDGKALYLRTRTHLYRLEEPDKK